MEVGGQTHKRGTAALGTREEAVAVHGSAREMRQWCGTGRGEGQRLGVQTHKHT